MVNYHILTIIAIFEKDYVANCELLSGRSRFAEILRRYEEQDKTSTLPMEMHIVAMGDIAFATNRFELYMDYQHRIQARSPFTQTFIVQLCAQPGLKGGGYLATERGVWGVGYSASVFCTRFRQRADRSLLKKALPNSNAFMKNKINKYMQSLINLAPLFYFCHPVFSVDNRLNYSTKSKCRPCVNYGVLFYK